MKKIYLLMAFLAVANVGWAQQQCDSCCQQSFPYEFCNPTDGSVFVACSINPNDDTSNGAPVKAFIPSCVIVDPMPGNAIWQPTGPPPQPGALLSNDDLDNNPNEEAGAAAQQASDEILFDQIPGQPPVDPGTEPSLYPVTTPPGPEPSCGDSAPYPDPQFPDRQAIWDRYVSSGYTQYGYNYVVPPWHHPYDYQWQNNWDDDETEYDAALAQWSLDSSDFLSGFDQEKTDESGMDGNATAAVTWYYNTDNGWLWVEYNNEVTTYDTEIEADSAYEACLSNLPDEISQWEQDTANYSKYLGAEAQYQADLTAWNTAANSYALMFNQAQAQSDANLALTNWLDQCTPPIKPCETGDSACCIHVVMDNNIDHFRIDPTGIVAQTTGSGLNTFLICHPKGCETNSVIEVNITSDFLGAERQSDANADDSSEYNLHTVKATEFYTGEGTPPTADSGYDSYSFFQLMEHEIGHYLGLHHPEDTVDGAQCHNCYTENPFINNGKMNPTGFRTVMALDNNIPAPGVPAHYPLDLTSEDQCQFQKLYCNSCGGGAGTPPCAYDAGVTTQPGEGFEAKIFPNPTTGACQLQYELLDRAFVQVAIYDMLGNQMRIISSGYEEEGTRIISLGTESLPSGHYVCRVRTGETVTYINVVVEK